MRRIVAIRGILRGRNVEFLWDNGGGRQLGSIPSTAPPLIVDALTREPLKWTLTPDEWDSLDEVIGT